MIGTFSIIDADHLNLTQGRNRNRFKFRAARPTTGEPSTMKVDQHSILVLGRDTRFGSVDIRVNTTDFVIFFIDGE